MRNRRLRASSVASAPHRLPERPRLLPAPGTGCPIGASHAMPSRHAHSASCRLAASALQTEQRHHSAHVLRRLRAGTAPPFLPGHGLVVFGPTCSGDRLPVKGITLDAGPGPSQQAEQEGGRKRTPSRWRAASDLNRRDAVLPPVMGKEGFARRHRTRLKQKRNFHRNCAGPSRQRG